MKIRVLALCLCSVGVAMAERPLETSGFYSSGPVSVTANVPGPHVICATRVIATPVKNKIEPTKVVLAFLNASDGRVLKVREAALKAPGQQGAGECLSATTPELLAGIQGPGALNIIAVAVENGIVLQGGIVVEGSNEAGGIPGGGCIVASLQIGTADSSTARYIALGHP